MFSKLLRSFFALPYSTDLDGKDVETLLRIVKGANSRNSRRKELFDIVDGDVGYSVKTLRKSPSAVRVDLQEQRFCDVTEVRRMMASGGGGAKKQGKILLSYMHNRIVSQMKARSVTVAKSLILLKWWDKARTTFSFRYWEEDFLGFIETLLERNERGEIQWLIQSAGVHARDRLRKDEAGRNVRLLRMHYKHNQIFTDHDIPPEAVHIEFAVKQVSWLDLAALLGH